jgi:hypothetical protein
MFTAITNTLASRATSETTIKNLNGLGNFLDFAGAITAIVLGALALTSLGGATIAHLNDVTGGAWATIGGGLITLYALHLQTSEKAKETRNQKSQTLQTLMYQTPQYSYQYA